MLARQACQIGYYSYRHLQRQPVFEVVDAAASVSTWLRAANTTQPTASSATFMPARALYYRGGSGNTPVFFKHLGIFIQPSMQRLDRTSRIQRMQGLQLLRRVRAEFYRNPGGAGIHGHLQIVGGVANHQRALHVLTMRAGQCRQHGLMLLGENFIGSARSVER